MTDTTLSIRSTLAGRRVLLTGATGFVGKIWLAMILEYVPEIERLYVLIRPRRDADARARLEQIVNESPVFGRLHERHGSALSAWLSDRVVPVDGDLTEPGLGLADDVSIRRPGAIDLVVNCAALVDFDPDVRLSYRANVLGSLNAADVARSAGAGLVHVSTCYVAGDRVGDVPEVIHADLPTGDEFDPESELEDLREAMRNLVARHVSDAFHDDLEREALDTLTRRGRDTHADAIRRHAERIKPTRVEEDWQTLGTARAKERGWVNTYTYTKAIAEGLLASRYPDVPKAFVRPSVVESALEFPFPGWNEGFNTSGPICYLIGTWYKALPGRQHTPFDVIPVDLVCRAIAIAAAQVVDENPAPVYQAATSVRNPFTLGRAVELSGLSHRSHLRRHGKTLADRLLRSRCDTIVADGSHPLDLPSVEDWLSRAGHWLRDAADRGPESWKKPARRRAFRLERNRRALRRVELMVDGFVPFTRDLRHRFVANALSARDIAEPEFRFQPESFDWRRYWLDVHMPGLRRWCFPEIDGEEVERLQPATPVRLGDSASPSAATVEDEPQRTTA